MGIASFIKRFTEKKKEKSAKFKQMEEDYRLQKMLEDRQKSSNERELERYFKEKREENIKKQLDKIHHQQTKENWKPTKSILDGGTPITRTDKPLLKEKNLFMNQKNIHQGGGMFFKR